MISHEPLVLEWLPMEVEKRFIMAWSNGSTNVRRISGKIHRSFVCFSFALDEIFNRNVLLFWSPNDRYLAFIKINLKNVPTTHFIKYDFSSDQNDQYSIPYPKFGETLPVLDVYIYSIQSGRVIRVPRPVEYEKLYEEKPKHRSNCISARRFLLF